MITRMTQRETISSMFEELSLGTATAGSVPKI